MAVKNTEVPAGNAALIFTAEPIFAGFFAWLLLGEIWTGRSIGGAGLIILGMVISSFFLLKANNRRYKSGTGSLSQY